MKAKVGNLFIDIAPVGDGEIIAFFFGDKALLELLLNLSGDAVALSYEIVDFWICWIIVFCS